MTPYQTVPGSTVSKVLHALDVAAVPMSEAALRDAIEYEGALGQILRRPVMMGVLTRTNGLYARGDTPTIIRERRSNYPRIKHAWRAHVQSEPSALIGNLRTLMDDGGAVSTGDPLRALADAMDAARAVLAARSATRFKGAEVELLVARELRSVTVAAQLATLTLQQALEVLQ